MSFSLPAVKPRPILVHQPEIVLENPWWNVFFDHVEFPNGARGRHLRLAPASGKPGAVALVIVELPTGPHVAFVSQWRHAQQRQMWELPRGFADPTDTSSSHTAAREVQAETGAEVTHTRRLGEICADSSILEGSVLVELVIVRQRTAAMTEEVDAVVWVPADRVIGLCASGEITDGYTLGAVALAVADPQLRPLLLPESDAR